MYKSKTQKLAGTSYGELIKKAKQIEKHYVSSLRRKPYVKSYYFDRKKVFLNFFWIHLTQKVNCRDKGRRLKYYPCALELIKKSTYPPNEKFIRDKTIFYRFYGVEKNTVFCVQVKEEKGKLWLVSVFPKKQKNFRQIGMQ